VFFDWIRTYRVKQGIVIVYIFLKTFVWNIPFEKNAFSLELGVAVRAKGLETGVSDTKH